MTIKEIKRRLTGAIRRAGRLEVELYQVEKEKELYRKLLEEAIKQQ